MRKGYVKRIITNRIRSDFDDKIKSSPKFLTHQLRFAFNVHLVSKVQATFTTAQINRLLVNSLKCSNVAQMFEIPVHLSSNQQSSKQIKTNHHELSDTLVIGSFNRWRRHLRKKVL